MPSQLDPPLAALSDCQASSPSDATLIPSETCLIKAAPTLIHLFPPGPTLGFRYKVDVNGVVIGRHPQSNIVSYDPSVSVIHAQVESRQDGRFVASDLGSTNGTFVNNVRIDSGTLRNDDFLRLGDSVYRFLSGADVEAQCRNEIAQLAAADPLTGLPTRSKFQESLEWEIGQATQHNRRLALIMIEINSLEAINDRFGRPVAGQVIRAVGIRVRDMVRVSDLLARYDGQVFAALMPGVGWEIANRIADRVRSGVAARPFLIEGRQLPVTVSVGLSTLTSGEKLSPGEMIFQAEARMDRAKRTGRITVSAPASGIAPPPSGSACKWGEVGWESPSSIESMGSQTLVPQRV